MALRLNSWLIKQGGVNDAGGDVLHCLGRHCDRPGLINKRGLSLDDAALKAWEEGYFFGPERPSVNDLLDAIAQDHNGKIPVFSEHDFVDVDETRQNHRQTEDPAFELLRRMVKIWRSGEGKRNKLRPLWREAERIIG